jgi:hypothetical protein
VIASLLLLRNLKSRTGPAAATFDEVEEEERSSSGFEWRSREGVDFVVELLRRVI